MCRRTVLVMALLACSAALARGEWNLAVYVGGTSTRDTYLLLDQPALKNRLSFRGVSYQGGSFETPIYYGSRGGYFLGRHLGLEAEFIHLKVFAKVERPVRVDGLLLGQPVSAEIPMNTVVGRFDISHGVNLTLGNVVFRQDCWRQPGQKLGRLLLSGRFGFGATIPHPESEILGAGEQHYQGGSPAFQAAGGAEFHLWRGLYGIGEYKFTRTRQHVRIVSGTAETLLRTHHLITGFAYHF